MSRVVLDTDVVIGALDRHDAHHLSAGRILLEALEAGTAVYLSVINYAEALVRPAQETSTLQLATDAIAALQMTLHSPDAELARDAARLRHMNISLADGFALATARRLGASIASFDHRVIAAAANIGLPVWFEASTRR